MSFAFGCFMFEIAFVKILKDELHAINKMAKHKKSHRNMYKNLSEFIRRHGDMKQLSRWTTYGQNSTQLSDQHLDVAFFVDCFILF